MSSSPNSRGDAGAKRESIMFTGGFSIDCFFNITRNTQKNVYKDGSFARTGGQT
jgi:hypothetical protein